MPVDVDKVEVKGQAFRSWIQCFGKLYGEKAHADLINNLPIKLATKVRDNLLLSSAWYPLRMYNELLFAGRAAVPHVPTFARDVSFMATSNDLNTLYRFILGLINSNQLASMIPKVAGSFCRGCVVQYKQENGIGVITADGMAISRFGWQDLLGGIEAMFTCAGKKHVRVRIAEGGDERTVATINVFFQADQIAEAT